MQFFPKVIWTWRSYWYQTVICKICDTHQEPLSTTNIFKPGLETRHKLEIITCLYKFTLQLQLGFISSTHLHNELATVYPKKYAHGFCFAMLCCGYTLNDFPISIRLTSLALGQSNDCPSASKATLMNMDKYFMWIHYERLHNHNKAKHNKTMCTFLGIYCTVPNHRQSVYCGPYATSVNCCGKHVIILPVSPGSGYVCLSLIDSPFPYCSKFRYE